MTMLQDADIGDGGGRLRFTCDFIGIEFHGDAHSHIGRPLPRRLRRQAVQRPGRRGGGGSVGATRQTIDMAKDGLVSRGVLIDIPRLRGSGWVEPGEAIMREEIEAAEQALGVRMGAGDIVLFRTGHARKRLDEGPWDAANAKAGIHATAMPLFHEREVAGIGYDGDGEAVPSNCEGVMYPIHAIGVNAMGLYFLDSLYLEDPGGGVRGRGAFGVPVRDRPAAAGRRHRLTGQPDRGAVGGGLTSDV